MKTKSISFVIAFFALTILFCQSGADRQQMYQLNRVKNDKFGMSDNLEFLRNRKQPLNHEKVVRTYRYGKKTYITTYLFNDKSQLLEIQRKNSIQLMTYFDDTLLSTIAFIGKKGVRHTDIKYVDNKKILEETFKDDRLISRIIIQYDNQDRVIFSSIDTKNTYSMAYTYNDKNLSWQRFMKNDKILKEWDYSCKKEGDLVSSKKQESICKYSEESNDGSRIEVTRTEVDGRVYLRKEFFDANKFKYKYEVYGKEDKLVSRTNFAKDGGSETETFNNDGKITEKSNCKIDTSGNVIEFTKYQVGKEKKMTKSVFIYNNQHEIIESAFYYKGKMKSQNVYEYVN